MVVNVMVASQLAKVYSWHKYHLQIAITTSDMAYRHLQSGRLEQEGRPPMATTSPHHNLLLQLCLLSAGSTCYTEFNSCT